MAHELIVDNFAGGGGASLGIEMALQRRVNVAINHDPVALAMHKANHPDTVHLCESVWDVEPVEVTRGLPVGLAWFSPDCTHFSKAKGSAPVKKEIRGLAWVVLRWAATVRPRVICLENVEEFTTWGPLGKDGRPCRLRRGETFRSFVHQLRGHGYEVEWRELRACDYGAPTIRKRLFLIARSDGLPIQWPRPTHGAPDSAEVLSGKLEPWRTAAECIDWSIPCPSIFDRKKPLAEATCRRIVKGIERYVLQGEPFVVDSLAPTLIQTGYGERKTQAPRVLDLHAPIGTLVSGGKHALAAAFLAKHYGGPNGNQTPGQSLREPMSTVTNTGQIGPVSVRLDAAPDRDRARQVAAFLTRYNGQGLGQDPGTPLGAVTSRDRYGLVLVEVEGETYAVADIGMRMLQPRELFRAQGFPDSYEIAPPVRVHRRGKWIVRPLTKTEQIKCVGNSVCPPMAAALARANVPELAARTGQQALWRAA